MHDIILYCTLPLVFSEIKMNVSQHYVSNFSKIHCTKIRSLTIHKVCYDLNYLLGLHTLPKKNFRLGILKIVSL